ncbi:MAG: hypothetical protein OCU20_09055 [Methanophagales archaeon]|nr:hypothetical protein [Methanophagales archaeon]
MEGDIFFGFQSYFIAILKDSAFCPRSNPRRRRMPLMETVFQQLSSSRFGSRLSLSTKMKCARNSSALVDSLDRTGYWPEIMERLERARAAVREHLDDAKLEAAPRASASDPPEAA